MPSAIDLHLVRVFTAHDFDLMALFRVPKKQVNLHRRCLSMVSLHMRKCVVALISPGLLTAPAGGSGLSACSEV